MFAGLLAAPVVPRAQYFEPQPPGENDSRLIRLVQFFEDNDCPINDLASDFIVAADRQDLDWRLLPSIAVVESGGGKRYRNNNVFGWNNGQEHFSSIRASIHAVADRLANSPLYRDKDVNGILRTYNPQNPDYAHKVKAVMQLIARVERPTGAVN